MMATVLAAWLACFVFDACESRATVAFQDGDGAFVIDANVTTVAEYDECVAAGSCVGLGHIVAPTDTEPVLLGWWQAHDYCGWRASVLPTNDELRISFPVNMSGITEWTRIPITASDGEPGGLNNTEHEVRPAFTADLPGAARPKAKPREPNAFRCTRRLP